MSPTAWVRSVQETATLLQRPGDAPADAWAATRGRRSAHPMHLLKSSDSQPQSIASYRQDSLSRWSNIGTDSRILSNKYIYLHECLQQVFYLSYKQFNNDKHALEERPRGSDRAPAELGRTRNHARTLRLKLCGRAPPGAGSRFVLGIYSARIGKWIDIYFVSKTKAEAAISILNRSNELGGTSGFSDPGLRSLPPNLGCSPS